jgi:hypothetical protein
MQLRENLTPLEREWVRELMRAEHSSTEAEERKRIRTSLETFMEEVPGPAYIERLVRWVPLGQEAQYPYVAPQGSEITVIDLRNR